MTRDDIIKMAKEAKLPYEYDTGRVLYLKELERFAALVAAHEREACAKVCDEKVDAEYATGKVDHNEMAWTQACAIAIRARGEQ
jgi:hypothetical protein